MNEVISHEDHFWLGLNDVAQEGGAHGSGDSFKFQTKSLLQAGSCGQRVTRCWSTQTGTQESLTTSLVWRTASSR